MADLGHSSRECELLRIRGEQRPSYHGRRGHIPAIARFEGPASNIYQLYTDPVNNYQRGDRKVLPVEAVLLFGARQSSLEACSEIALRLLEQREPRTLGYFLSPRLCLHPRVPQDKVRMADFYWGQIGIRSSCKNRES